MTATPRSGLAALAALAALACAAPATPGSDAVALLPRPDRVVVAPLNLGVRLPPELRGSETPVREELLRYLGAQDRTLAVVDASDAARLWNAAAAEVEASGAAFGPGAVASRFAQLLAGHAEYGVLVMPSLVVRRARVGGHHAWWDGVRRALPTRTPLPLSVDDGISGLAISGYRGSIAAASLYVAILASDGKMLYEGLGGLDVIQEVARVARAHDAPQWSLEPRRDSFADAAELREGIERAFERGLPATARAW
jgi:hypothetical protein